MSSQYARLPIRTLVIAVLATGLGQSDAPAQTRPAGQQVVGVAFGGGSARGIAHIGVIQWFEEHRIPIDLVAGTSMGGLVGGSYASGMSAAELRAMIEGTDWDVMFGSSSFGFKNLRRKRDARSYPSRLEFGLKGGIVAPSALNDGQQVDLLLARIAAPYYAVESFDDLPTPFRCVAVDLVSADRIVIGSGSLAQAMRATMSLPGVFPPMQIENRVLVDGGALDNVPADVVREMGATVVIAVDVGVKPEAINYSLFSLMGRTVDVMMTASTRRAVMAADHTIKVDVEGFGSLDWRRSSELIQRGYQAAARLEAELLPLALEPDAYRAWQERRNARRQPALPAVQFLATSGMTAADAGLARKALARYLNAAPDVPALERDLSALAGLDRYEGIDLADDGAAREGRAAYSCPREGLRTAVRDARHQPREHDVERLQVSACRPLPWFRHVRNRLGTSPRFCHRIGSIARGSRLSANRNVRAVCARYRRTASDHVRPRRRRSGRRAVPGAPDSGGR